MVVGRVEGNGSDRPAGIEIYESDDLKNWTYLSTYESGGTAWECPDLYELPVSNISESRWVMTVSADADHVEHHIGQFDGTTFTAENTVYADSGWDFYAAQSWANEPATDSRLGLAWTSHWDYAPDTPEDGWKGAQSFPRRITLRDTGSEVVPIQQLDGAVESNRDEVVADLSNEPLSADDDPLAGTETEGEMLELLATIDPGTADTVTLKLRKGGTQETRITYDIGMGELFVDRSDAGAFFGDTNKDVASQPVALRSDGILKLRVFVDRSIVSTFANDGEKTMTNRIYPDETSVHATMTASGGTATVDSLTAWEYAPGLVDGATYRLENLNSGKVLEVKDAGTSDGDAVQQWDYLGYDHQKWVAHEVSEGIFRFENVNSGKVLDITDASTSDGAYAMQWDWWDGDNQQWTVDRTPDGYYRVRNVNSGKVLDVEDSSTSDGARCMQWEWWNGDNQQWALRRIE